FRDFGTSQVTCVYSFVDYDPRILAESPSKLTVTDIDGIDTSRAARHQHLGKAAGRGPDIERDASLDGDLELIERMHERDPSSRYPRMTPPLERQHQISRELFSRFVDAPSVAPDEACEDQRLSLRPAFRQALFNEELVGAPSCRHRPEGQARAGCAAISRP